MQIVCSGLLCDAKSVDRLDNLIGDTSDSGVIV